MKNLKKCVKYVATKEKKRKKVKSFHLNWEKNSNWTADENPNKDALKGYLNERLQLKPTGIEPGTGLIKIFYTRNLPFWEVS